MLLFPRKHRARVDAVSREAMLKVSAWLGGQLLLAGVIGATSAIGLWALGIPFFYVLALLSAVGEMIPVVGPILAAIPAIAVASTVSLQKVLFVVIFFLVQQQIENHVLVPKIMSRQVGVSAVTVIVALLIGGSLLGIVGALLAVPTAAILQVVAAELMAEDSEGEGNQEMNRIADPRQDGDQQVEPRQRGDDAVDRRQVERDPERAGRRLGRRQREPLPHRSHQPAEQRVALDRQTVLTDANVGKDAVTCLGDQENHHHNIAGSRAHAWTVSTRMPSYTALLCAMIRSPTLDRNSTR